MPTELSTETDMTVQEFYSGFNLDFMTPEEVQTIYKATELFALGKVKSEALKSVEKDKEIERLKGLIEKAYDYAREHHFTRYPDKTWQQFKTENNL